MRFSAGSRWRLTDLTDPSTAFREIDRVLDAVLRYRRPGYIEVPRDMVHVIPGNIAHAGLPAGRRATPVPWREALAEAERRIMAARKPVIVADVEVHRFGLQHELLTFAEKSGIPIATAVLGKSVISERHPLFVGIYEGAMGREEVTRFVEESDLIILLGFFMTDLNLGIFTANLDPAKCIYATSETLRISHHHFHGVLLSDFLEGLVGLDITTKRRPLPSLLPCDSVPFQLRPEAPICIERVTARLNEFLCEQVVVIADVGDALFASSELVIHRQTEYLAPAYYTSMGFSIPAALGAMVARPDLRAVVMVGDGAFQMTGMELSTIVRRQFAPIIIVLDNGGYGTERLLHPGEFEFNEIHPWRYHKLPEVLGGGRGYEVRTEGEFDHALRCAWSDTRRDEPDPCPPGPR